MSRRYLIPTNFFYRQNDPVPPDFPEPNTGDAYFNTVTKTLRIYYDAAWRDLEVILDEGIDNGGSTALLSGVWDYQNQSTGPATSGGIRTDASGPTEGDTFVLWLSPTDKSGYDWSALVTLQVDDRLVLRSTGGETWVTTIEEVRGNTEYLVRLQTATALSPPKGQDVNVALIRPIDTVTEAEINALIDARVPPAARVYAQLAASQTLLENDGTNLVGWASTETVGTDLTVVTDGVLVNTTGLYEVACRIGWGDIGNDGSTDYRGNGIMGYSTDPTLDQGPDVAIDEARVLSTTWPTSSIARHGVLLFGWATIPAGQTIKARSFVDRQSGTSDMLIRMDDTWMRVRRLPE